ncbi:hypothetical protein [uncultured Mitsuokella sp.]|uniref:hypothetical protein n=1 Tax=uncultured Mitsuokella sp. TaxID=453120 RepID=UPI002609BA00|nr:hypothetical protein [uncultured Mitsuokella sp.]
MVAGIILFVLIAGLSYVVGRLFRINEKNEMEQARRQFEIAQKERAVEIVREAREKRQRMEAGAVRRIGSMTTQLRRDFPSTAPLATRLAHRSKAMKAEQERKQAARARAERMYGYGPVDLYDEPTGGLSYDYADDYADDEEAAPKKAARVGAEQEEPARSAVHAEDADGGRAEGAPAAPEGQAASASPVSSVPEKDEPPARKAGKLRFVMPWER